MGGGGGGGGCLLVKMTMGMYDGFASVTRHSAGRIYSNLHALNPHARDATRRHVSRRVSLKYSAWSETVKRKALVSITSTNHRGTYIVFLDGLTNHPVGYRLLDQ